jgi:hypothetical protein
LEAEFKFGHMDVLNYRVGDAPRWGGGLRTPRRRPVDGNYIGDGYVECPSCRRDFWVTIDVVHDVIQSVEVNPAKPGYLPSRP